MDQASAAVLLAELDRACSDINQPLLVSSAISSENTESLSKSIGEVIGRIYLELMVPIVRQYPELDPDGGTDGDCTVDGPLSSDGQSGSALTSVKEAIRKAVHSTTLRLDSVESLISSQLKGAEAEELQRGLAIVRSRVEALTQLEQELP